MTRRVWLVTERAYGKTTGWRHFIDLADALETAGTWVSQSVGDVTISRTEVEAWSGSCAPYGGPSQTPNSGTP